jgi:hypothetical protein
MGCGEYSCFRSGGGMWGVEGSPCWLWMCRVQAPIMKVYWGVRPLRGLVVIGVGGGEGWQLLCVLFIRKLG